MDNAEMDHKTDFFNSRVFLYYWNEESLPVTPRINLMMKLECCNVDMPHWLCESLISNLYHTLGSELAVLIHNSIILSLWIWYQHRNFQPHAHKATVKCVADISWSMKAKTFSPVILMYSVFLTWETSQKAAQKGLKWMEVSQNGTCLYTKPFCEPQSFISGRLKKGFLKRGTTVILNWMDLLESSGYDPSVLIANFPKWYSKQ